MELTITQHGIKTEYPTLVGYVESKLDGDDYGSGSVEAAATTARNNSQAIGRLLEVLVDKNLLDANEVVQIVGDYSDPTITLDLK